MELLDHLGGPCGSLLVLMSGKIGDDVHDRDSITKACVIFRFQVSVVGSWNGLVVRRYAPNGVVMGSSLSPARLVWAST